MSSEPQTSSSPDEQLSSEITTSPQETLSEIISRTRSLYSLPAVAVEVIQLTSNLQVDARALKKCIEKDPALTAKILRVVNSSLFGLSREVSDLNQALALLGTKPLKLLVLGFSLPEGLFADVAREQLDWYWKTTLVRAVAAREISETLWNRPGDDAFLAGLLQDIGVLVLLDQLREPYAQFLGRVIEERGNLDAMEVKSLGFDHTELSAGLLRKWNMPDVLVEAIAEKREYESLNHKQTPVAELARVLHLASLLAELVGQNRLHVLPELLEAGGAYCGFDNDRLHDIIPVLQDKVQQLAEVLSLDLVEGNDYTQIALEAHAQMAEISERVAAHLSHPMNFEEKAYEKVLVDANQLRSAVGHFLRSPLSSPVPSKSNGRHSTPETTAPSKTASPTVPSIAPDGTTLPVAFAEKLTWAVGNCRSRRLSLSLLYVELRGGNEGSPEEQQWLSRVLETACYEVDASEKRVEQLEARRWTLILPGYDRQQTVRFANELIREVEQTLQQYYMEDETFPFVVSVGVASVTLPPKNFPPLDLVAAAQRCLSAARSSETSVVKSLEIF